MLIDKHVDLFDYDEFLVFSDRTRHLTPAKGNTTPDSQTN